MILVLFLTRHVWNWCRCLLIKWGSGLNVEVSTDLGAVADAARAWALAAAAAAAAPLQARPEVAVQRPPRLDWWPAPPVQTQRGTFYKYILQYCTHWIETSKELQTSWFYNDSCKYFTYQPSLTSHCECFRRKWTYWLCRCGLAGRNAVGTRIRVLVHKWAVLLAAATWLVLPVAGDLLAVFL